MNVSSGINSSSPTVTPTQIGEMKTALQLQEQALDLLKTSNNDRSIPPSSTKGTRVDICI